VADIGAPLQTRLQSGTVQGGCTLLPVSRKQHAIRRRKSANLEPEVHPRRALGGETRTQGERVRFQVRERGMGQGFLNAP